MKKQIILLAAVLITGTINAQFEGSYILKMESSSSKKPIPDMKFTVKGDMATGEIVDRSQANGFKKNIMNKKDRTMLMLMDKNGNKVAMKNKMPEVKASPNDQSEPKITATGKTKMIEGYNCKEIISENEESTADLWTTDELGLSMTDMLGFAGKTNDPVYGNAISLETTISNKKDNSKTVMYIKNIKKYSVPDSQFSTEGYQIMEMPAMNFPGMNHH